MGFSIGRTTGEKCLETGVYNPEHKSKEKVDLRIFKDETYPSYDGNAKTKWVKTDDLFSRYQIEHAQSVLRESISVQRPKNF